MAEGYWLRGDQVIDVTDSSHLSAMEGSPNLFGLPLDLVAFAHQGEDFDESAWYEYAIGVALSKGWVRVRHNLGLGVDNWVFEFRDYPSCSRTIEAFVAVLSARDALDSHTDILFVGRNDGFHGVYHFRNGCLADDSPESRES